MSRTGFVALLVSAVAFALIDTESKSYLKSHKWLILSVIAVTFVVGAGAFCLKKDSALGRFHIWEMELRAIADKPLTGHGFGKSLGAYGDAQAEYFETEERGQERVRIAGCPEYAFNEYLHMGMEFGDPWLVVVGGCHCSRNDDAMPFRFFIDIWARGVGHIRDGFISFGCVAVTIAFGRFFRGSGWPEHESR